ASAETSEGGERQGRRAVEEVRLREELRHARLLADTYQSRTLELEKIRMELEDQVRSCKTTQEKEELQRQKLSNEVNRLRAERETAKAAKVAYEAEKSAMQAATGTPNGSRRGLLGSTNNSGLLGSSSATSSFSSRPGSARGQRPAATTAAAASSFGRAAASAAASAPRSPRLAGSATEPLSRRLGSGLAAAGTISTLASPRDLRRQLSSIRVAGE
ncbi:unnamed protein product, partial [Polarella glacialis]